MSDQPIPLTQAELTQLENDTENGTTNIPAGYSDILAISQRQIRQTMTR